jgi:hypothetical protein
MVEVVSVDDRNKMLNTLPDVHTSNEPTVEKPELTLSFFCQTVFCD